MKKTFLLCILDGVGVRASHEFNAWANASKPRIDELIAKFPHTTVSASGKMVGLPAGQMGNSEVGHMNIGAGRIVYQPQEMINESIESGEFFNNPHFIEVINHTKDRGSKLHIMGLMSDGGVHSHINHLFALIDLCRKEGVDKVYLHLFTDGRDTGVHSGQKYAQQLEKKIADSHIGTITTVSGRYYAMDRDNNYDRVQLAYNAIVTGQGEAADNIEQVFTESYANDITDEFIKPTVINEGRLESGDGIMVFNYRPDRMREMCTALTNPDAVPMETKNLHDIKFVSMMPINDSVKGDTAFNLTNLNNVMGVYLGQMGLNQLRIAETEKYAHVTYFFDGGKELEIPGEKRILIPSPKVATYDLKPEMSAGEITEALLSELDKDQFDVIVLNFANGDMVGHTGNYEAAVRAVEFMDRCIGRLYDKIKEIDGTMLITADHGNCELMVNDDGSICTTHTTNPVPVIITKPNLQLRDDGLLSDVAPTILDILGLPSPVEMGGKTLIK